VVLDINPAHPAAFVFALQNWIAIRRLASHACHAWCTPPGRVAFSADQPTRNRLFA
jgi:hypothetical protein